MKIPTARCAFDDSSIINSCVVTVPPAWQPLFGATRAPKNAADLRKVLDAIHASGQRPLRFIPAPNLERHLIRQAQELVGNATFLSLPAQKEFIDQLRTFVSTLPVLFEEITKDPKVSDLRTWFSENKRPLKKMQNGYSAVPEDDDLSILQAYSTYPERQRILISADEHFWGYADIITPKLDIHVVEEWRCLTVL